MRVFSVVACYYGVQLHQPRNVREKRFTDVIHSTIYQGGCVLIITRDPRMVQGIPRLPWALISQHTHGQGRRLIPAARLLSYQFFFFFLFHIVSKNISIHISIFIFCNFDTGCHSGPSTWAFSRIVFANQRL